MLLIADYKEPQRLKGVFSNSDKGAISEMHPKDKVFDLDTYRTLFPNHFTKFFKQNWKAFIAVWTADQLPGMLFLVEECIETPFFIISRKGTELEIRFNHNTTHYQRSQTYYSLCATFSFVAIRIRTPFFYDDYGNPLHGHTALAKHFADNLNLN